MASKKNTEAPAAKIARNPSDASARSMYEAVIAQEGAVGGKPARIALYGTKYAALEVGGEGAWEVHHDTAFGGVRAIESLKGGFDEVLVLGGDSREIQLTAGNVAVVEPEIAATDAVDEALAAYNAEGDRLAAEGFFGPADVAETVAALPVVAEPAEPVLATLEEVRAAFDAETRGACRASVLRALRVRAGEIALGLLAGGKIERAPKPASDTVRQRTTKLSLAEMIERGIVAVGDEVRIKSKPEIVTTIAAGALTADGRTFNQWASESLNAKALNVYVNAVHVKSGKLLDDLRGE